MSAILVQELVDRLELHLDQLCDVNACETLEHAETRRLIERARAWSLMRAGHVHLHIDPPPPRVIVVPDPRGGMRS